MQSVHNLQDLKSKLSLSGFEIQDSIGWYITTVHGTWTMAFGVVYLNGQPIKNIADAPILKKIKKKTKVEKEPIKKPKKKK